MCSYKNKLETFIETLREELFNSLLTNGLEVLLQTPIEKRKPIVNHTLPLAVLNFNNIDSLLALLKSRTLSINSMLLRNVFESLVSIQYILEHPETSEDYYYFNNFKLEKKKGTPEQELKEKYPRFFTDKKTKNWHGFNTFKDLVIYLNEKYPEGEFLYDEYFAAPSKVVHPSSLSLRFYLDKSEQLNYQYSGFYADLNLLFGSILLTRFVDKYRMLVGLEFLKIYEAFAEDAISLSKSIKQSLE